MPVQVHDYDELKLRLERAQGGAYRIFCSASSGEASGSFELPFSDVEVENFVLRASRSTRGRRRMESSEMHEAKRFGGRLFESLVQRDVRDVYHSALTSADNAGRGLRITLYLTDVPELMHLPWEYLYDDPNFLAISAWTPVVRYLDLPRPRRPLEVQPPLRILAMVSSPSDAVPLDVSRERANLEGALGKLIEAGAVELKWLEEATLSALLRELRHEDFHVFHYVGHGLYDAQAEDGLLLLEDDEERGRAVSGSQLGTILHDCTSLRLAVLNACEGARTARDDPFAGVAASLVQRNLPAVIAMQFEITDQAAVIFAGGFYEALAAGYPVDAALAEARKAIFADHNDIEWGTPVLFMRVADGRIFDVSSPPAPPPVPKLELSLSAQPSQIPPGAPVTWSASVRNEGGSPLSEVSMLDGEGRLLEGPFSLDAGLERSITWTSAPWADLDQTVTAGGRTEKGELVNAQAMAHVSVRGPAPVAAESAVPVMPPPAARVAPPPVQPITPPPLAPATPPPSASATPPPSAPVTPSPSAPATRPPRETPTEPSAAEPFTDRTQALPWAPLRAADQRPRFVLGEVIAALGAIMLMASLALTWDKLTGASGWSVANHAGLILVLAAVAVGLAAWRSLGSVRGWAATATGAAIAVAGLVAEDRLVLESSGAGTGRYVAILAAAVVALGGLLALAADAGLGDRRSPPRGELVAAVGGLVVVASLWLVWTASGKIGWKFTLTDIALASLAGVVILGALACAASPRLGVSWATAGVVILVGLILIARVITLNDLVAGQPADFPWKPGRVMALAGALTILLGGAIALLRAAGPQTTRAPAGGARSPYSTLPRQ